MYFFFDNFYLTWPLTFVVESWFYKFCIVSWTSRWRPMGFLCVKNVRLLFHRHTPRVFVPRATTVPTPVHMSVLSTSPSSFHSQRCQAATAAFFLFAKLIGKTRQSGGIKPRSAQRAAAQEWQGSSVSLQPDRGVWLCSNRRVEGKKNSWMKLNTWLWKHLCHKRIH